MQFNAAINVFPNEIVAIVIAIVFHHIPTIPTAAKKGVDPILRVLWFLHLVSFF
jgi:hypothetical protein